VTEPAPAADGGTLAGELLTTWQAQADDGFLLSDPDASDIEVTSVLDPVSGVAFRFRWLPHREIRFDVPELERRGILNPNRDSVPLFHDPRDPSGHHCFLCIDNIEVCHPMEALVPVHLAGRDYVAGANFAWIGRNHYTVMAVEHMDQDFTPHVLEAMLDLHRLTEGGFRVLYNGAQAGATIPWHLHYQITTDRFPVEGLPPGAEATYPAAVWRSAGRGDGVRAALGRVEEWLGRDPEHHRVNLLVAGAAPEPVIHVFARDARKTYAEEKGLMGGFEICGDLVYSEPGQRHRFEAASVELARRVIAEVRPAEA
jgi:hypothetical protein